MATYTLGGTVSIANAGGVQNTIKVIGYATTRGDNPTGDTRPTLATGANVFTSAADWEWSYLIFTGTGTSVLTTGAETKVIRCKVVNSSTTTGRAAITGGTGSTLFGCEAISYRGTAILTGAAGYVVACNAHDSSIGINSNGTTLRTTISRCLVHSCYTTAVECAGSVAGLTIEGCTIFNQANSFGTGINLATAMEQPVLVNNTISGFLNGVYHVDANNSGMDNFNNYYGNDTDVTNWTKGSSDVALDPGFSSVTVVTGSTATTSSGNLVDSGKDFTALGVVAGRDYLLIKSGTGVTVGVYPISSVGTTTITPSIAPGDNATADKVYYITTGRNFAPGINLRAVGYPGAFAEGYTTSYLSIGAVQDSRYWTSPGDSNVLDGVTWYEDGVQHEGDLPVFSGRTGLGILHPG